MGSCDFYEEKSMKVTLEAHERQPCEVWTRVMGYHRPVQNFNRGKQGEFLERKYFREQAPQKHPLRKGS